MRSPDDLRFMKFALKLAYENKIISKVHFNEKMDELKREEEKTKQISDELINIAKSKLLLTSS